MLNGGFDYSKLGLNFKQTRVLVSAEYNVIRSEIIADREEERKREKKIWLGQWEEIINNYLIQICQGEYGNARIITDNIELSKEFISMREELEENKVPLYLILLELSLFEPYFPLIPEEKVENEVDEEVPEVELAEDEDNENTVPFISLKNIFINRTSSLRKPFKKNLFKFDRNQVINSVKIICRNNLGIYENLVDDYYKKYKKNMDKIKGTLSVFNSSGVGLTSTNIADSYLSAPVSNYLVDEESFDKDLSKIVAAISAVVTASGFGISGNTVTLTSGSSILGLGSGIINGINSKILLSKEFILSQSAKLEIIMKNIILEVNGDKNYAEDMVKMCNESICKLKNQIYDLRKQGKNKEIIVAAIDTVKILEKSGELLEESCLDSVVKKSEEN